MKAKILLLSILFIPFTIKAQKTVWAKVLTKQEANVKNNHQVCTDGNNNFYVMANFNGKINFGSIALESAGNSSLTDAFIAKIDPAGEEIFWGIQISSTGTVEGKSITADRQNNVYVTGSFEGKTTFGNTSISPKQKYGFFIAKYNSSGELQWVKQGGNYDTKWNLPSTFGYAVKTDNAGNVYISTAVLGGYDDWKYDPSLPLEKQYLGKFYYEDEVIENDELGIGNNTVIIKFTPDGEIVWKRICAWLSLIDFAIDDNENIYLTGSVSGTVVFDGKKLETNGLTDIIVFKFNKEGKTDWIKQFGKGELASSGAYASTPATDVESGQFIDVDRAGNVYLTGTFMDGAKFDDRILSSDAIVNGTELPNIFLAKLDLNGNIKWIIKAEGKGTGVISGMLCDKAGNTYLSASMFTKKATFDGKKAKGPLLQSLILMEKFNG